jgi:hypothetical protein
VAFVFFAIAVHELGHMVFGFMTGYRFGSLSLLSFLWFKEGKKIRFKKTKSIGLGQCLMVPASDERKFRFVLYNLGGVLINLIFAAAAMIPMMTFGVRHYIFYIYILLMFVLAHFLMGLISIVPMGSRGVPNDGMNVLTALRSKEAKHGLFLAFFLNSELMSGRRMRDFDDRIFAVGESADIGNYFVAYTVMCEASRLYDMGEYGKSLEQYERINAGKLPAYYGASLNLDLIYHYVMHRPDFEKAQKIYADKKTGVFMRFFLKLNMPSALRVLAAYEYFANGDKEKGMMYLKQAEKAMESHTNSGLMEMEKEYLSDLKRKIES